MEKDKNKKKTLSISSGFTKKIDINFKGGRKKEVFNIEKKKPEIIQVVNDSDIDPLETSEWLESLTAVIEKDGNQRAHYLIKELINKAYMEGANIPYTQTHPT